MEKIRSDTWNVNGFPLVFKPWSPTVVDELTITHVPVWVLFPNLDPCFWSQAGLSKLASAVGDPIFADEHTTAKSKLAFARILVDVDLSKELPKAIKINSPYRGFLLQKVEYEWVPHFCTSCKRVGHIKDRCNPNSKPKAKTVYRTKQSTQTAVPQKPAVVVENPHANCSVHKDKSPPPAKGTSTVATKLSNRFSLLQKENLIEPVSEDSSELVNVVDIDPGEDQSLDLESVVKMATELDPGDADAHRVDCGAIIETHVKNNAIKEISKVFTGFQLIHNNDYHHNGRIWVLWKPHIISLTVLQKSAQHIHCSLLHLASQRRVEVTFVYAYNTRSDRRDLWNALLDICAQAIFPWLCSGDFNVVLNMDERLGSTHLNLADMNEFSQCLDTCALVDHPATGCHVTWNNRHGDGLRWAKVDRILISQQWITNLNSTAAFLTAGISDHSPCLVTISDLYTPRPSSFKYLNCWASSPQFQNVVTDGWSSHYYGGHINSLFQKLKRLRSCLKGIHTTSFTNLSERVAAAK
ncbi:uncharacterized protein LOC141607191 [Silene latifolia]|uniref:uncharacterized protein LOC141607191 n=1 Tax=Silene latifolia TaxID=37657 RepID=UPI003D76C2AE